MRTLKFTLLISTLFLLTTSCTDLTEDIVPNNNDNQTELTYSIDIDNPLDPPVDGDTGGDDGNSGGTGKGN
ncbi:MAG: hypothetical protein HWD89_01980 [Tenacibaculum sp.]|uniref:hypothetical protein n=1 Tax=Tenacibaculum sp. TaxID=1906242 RepID=UPI0017FC0E70|nr:hypothetical protein [Tenacibaculum sp.]NVK07794.1 hypothetical protein [Tenacibaculum sp.]